MNASRATNLQGWWAVAALLLTAVCSTACYEPSGDGGRNPNGNRQPRPNRVPIVTQLGTVTINEGDTIRIVVQAFDPDGDDLTFSVGALPPGATFDAERALFEWTTDFGAADHSPYGLSFTVSDGELSARTQAVIIVEPAVLAIGDIFPNRIHQLGGEQITVRGIGFHPPVTAVLGGVPVAEIERIDERTLQITAPPLPGRFGVQPLTVTIGDGRSTTRLSAVFVFSEAEELGTGVHRSGLPDGTTRLAAVRLDGSSADTIAASNDEAVWRIDPLGADGPRKLVDGAAAELLRASFDGDAAEDLLLRGADGRVLAWLAGPEEAVELHDGAVAAVAIARLDLEGDGDDEAIVADAEGNILLYPSFGDGRFGDPIVTAATLAPQRLEAVDLGADGITDLLLELEAGFAWYRGVETGAFIPAPVVEESLAFHGAYPEVREDPPAVLVGALSDTELVYFEHIAGPFWRIVRRLELDDLAGPAAAADVIGDPGLEVLRPDAGAAGVRIDAVAGDRLEPASWWMLGPVAGEVVRGDFDGDGNLDVLLRSVDGAEAVWAEGRGPDLPPSLPLGLETAGGLALLAEDFNRDGYLDVVVSGATSGGGLPAQMLFRFDGWGNHATVPVPLPSVPDARDVALADVTADGWADVVTLDEFGELSCFPSMEFSTYGPPVVLPALESNPWRQVRGLRRPGTSAPIVLRHEDGSLALYTADIRCNLTELPAPDGIGHHLDVVDIEGDGRSELAVIDGGGVALLSSMGGDSYQERFRLDLEAVPAHDLDTADVDGDGQPDLLVATDQGVFALIAPIGNGAVLSEAWPIDLEPAQQVSAADLNGDGIDEVVAAGGGQVPRVLWMDGDSVRIDPLDAWHRSGMSPVLGDVDGDADIDLITLEPGFGAVIWPSAIVP